MNSADIVKLLASKHTEDVFVTECRDGPSLAGSHSRLDAWAMRKSWSNPTTFGYEIKVSRQDFLRDEKWHRYLDLCSQFYFVCPDSLIKAEELPPQAGLYYVSKTGSRLWLKKKAMDRPNITIPESLFRYILMGRVRIVGEYGSKASPGDYWKQWLHSKSEDLETGQLIGRRIREVVSKKVDEQSFENIRLKKELEGVHEIAAVFRKLGIDPYSYDPAHSAKQRLERLAEIVPADLRFSLKRLASELERVNTALNPKEENTAP